MIIKVEKKQSIQEEVNLITIKNNVGFEVSLTDFGAAIYYISYPDRKGNIGYATICPKDFNEYLHSGSNFGKLVGRVAGRLKDAVAVVNNKEYQLEKNDGNNCLHSGSSNYGLRFYDFEIKSNKNKVDVIFTLDSKDGDGGFPGNAKIKIVYTIYENKKELNIKFNGKCDQATLMNLTTHVYLNLNGGIEPIYNQELYLRSSKVSKLDDGLIIQDFIDIPTYLNYKELTKLGNNLRNPNLMNHGSHGMDHIFLLDGINKKVPSAILYDPTSKRKMTLYTDYPAIVVYGYNHPDKTENLAGVVDDENYGITFETAIPTNDYDKITFSKERPYSYFAKFKFN